MSIGRTRAVMALGASFLAACAARSIEETGSTAAAVKVADNVPITTTTGFDTTSVGVVIGPPDIGCPGGCPNTYRPVIGFQDDLPAHQKDAFLQLDKWSYLGDLHSSAEWGVPVELPSRAAPFTGYAGLANIVVPDDGAAWDYVGVGVTGPDHFRSEVTVAHRGLGSTWSTHLLTKQLNPAYYPFLTTSGSPNGNWITNVAAAWEQGSYPGKVWVTWTATIECNDTTCVRGVTFLTWYRFNASSFEQGPTWKLDLPRGEGPIAEYGQAAMTVIGDSVAIAWPDAAPDRKYACASTHPVHWHLSEIKPRVDAGDHAIAPDVSDTVFLTDDAALECLPGVDADPGRASTSFRPTIFWSADEGAIWVGAPKHIVKNNVDYGTRLMMKSTKLGSGAFPIAGTMATCSTGARVTEVDFPLDDAPCHQFGATSAISKIPGRTYRLAMLSWKQAGVGTKGLTTVLGATFTPIFPMDFEVFDLARPSSPTTHVPWRQTNPPDIWTTPWGRYDGIGVNWNEGKFVAAWADNRNDTVSGLRTDIWSAEVVP